MGDRKLEPQEMDEYPWLVVWCHGSHAHQIMQAENWNDLPDFERGGEYERVSMHQTPESAGDYLVDLLTEA